MIKKMAKFPLWCDCCHDIVIAVYPCKFVFHDKHEIALNICPDCMKTGVLVIDLPRRNLISVVLSNIIAKKKWKKKVN